MSSLLIPRRRLLEMLAGSVGGLLVEGCDRLGQSPALGTWFDRTEDLTLRAQRALIGHGALAREYMAADVSAVFRSNGTSEPTDPGYQRLLAGGFEQWRLTVGGLVDRPASYSLAELRSFPARTQITRHDCVEGWSAIAAWTGVPLSIILRASRLQPGARYIVFYCADTLDRAPGNGDDPETGRYYESIDLIDAFHAQTILAYSLNGHPLPVANGAPLRLRVERQLGYKHAKYLMRVLVTDRIDAIRAGKGGFWEDRGYEWYAGI